MDRIVVDNSGTTNQYRTLKILLASSEIAPFAKTGGLADVCGSLPAEIARMGHEPVLFMPEYRGVDDHGVPIETLNTQLEVNIGQRTVRGGLRKSHLPGSDVPVYFVAQDELFKRAGIYGEAGEGYVDNCERFVFFCRGVLEAIRLLNLQVDVVHLNDWPTSLIAAYLKTEYAGLPQYEQIATLFTIHNIAYQGVFWHWDMLLTGLDWKYFNWHQMEYHGNLNLMKTGIVFADSLNTVSPRYAEEIQSAPLGCGLEGILRHRSDVLSGIINGVDYAKWNPATDNHLPRKYDVDSFVAGKAECKAALQQSLGLPTRTDVPLVGLVGRLAGQKGLDLVIPVVHKSMAEGDAQWVILGTGEHDLENQLRALADHYPDRVAVRIEFFEPLAHQIEAGADMFMMASQYEPCGLNQLYSLKYGAVPLVRRTGGLADTVTNADDQTLGGGTATGFSFDEYTADALADTLRRACDIYHNKDLWNQIVATGMRQDWGWSKSAAEYVALYETTKARRSQQTVSG